MGKRCELKKSSIRMNPGKKRVKTQEKSTKRNVVGGISFHGMKKNIE